MTGEITQYAFHFDARACSGCKACQVACKDKHGLEVGRLWRRVYEVSGGDWRQQGNAWFSDVFAYNLSIACNHCEKPICIEVCPASAITKRDDGIVLLDSDKCLGCGYCGWACPYDALQYDTAAGHMTKCTFCVDEIDQGRPPVCVAACPMRVLEFGDHSIVKARHNGSNGNNGSFPLPAPYLTEPALVVTPHKDAHRSQNEPVQVIPSPIHEMKDWSLVAFTLLSQMGVGALLTLAIIRSLLTHKVETAAIERLSESMLLVIIPVMVLSLLISLLHLGKPRNAYRALANLRSSWLSREILFATLFTSAGVLLLGMHRFHIGTNGLDSLLTWISVLFGLALVLSMARVYMLRTVPTWNTLITPLSFFVTTLLLGAGMVDVIFLGNYAHIIGYSDELVQLEIPTVLRGIAISSVLFLWIVMLVYRFWFVKSRSVLGPSKTKVTSHLKLIIFRLSWLLTVLGLSTLVVLLHQLPLNPEQEITHTILALIAFGLILAGEVIVRYSFYEANKQYGIHQV